jgi:signal transduction histidine kinase/CheY-like chemotaxis protein
MHHFIVDTLILSAVIRQAWRMKWAMVSPAFFILAGFFLLLPAGGLRADEQLPVEADYSQPWQITSYSKDAGLSQQRIFDIAFTPDGNVWLAADDGLHRFDGFAWNVFGTNNGLPSSFTRAVCADKQGRLWVGSDAGAGVWDLQQQKYDPCGSQTGLANANVREIDQDPDGTLWFSCDQWPETTAKPGGLSRLKTGTPGQWETFHQTNGLPMNYVIGYFRDSTGRQFAMTPHGWGQRQGEKWGPPANPGYAAEDCVLQMAEARDGTLFAQGERTLLTLTDGRWQSHPDSHTRLVCATRNGEVAAVEYNPERGQLWFSRWDGRQFVRASAPVSCPAGARLYHLRQAPDGSLWCVGTGTVVRWNFHAEKWTLYPQLPPPVGTDALGRVWFAGESNITVCSAGRFQTLAPGKLRAWSAEGQAMIWDAQRDELTVTAPQDPTLRTVVETGCESISSITPDKNGVFWILGQDKKDNGIVARYDNGQTKIMASPEFYGQQLSSGTPWPPAQLLVVAHQRDNNLYGLARIAEDKVEWLSFTTARPPLTYPNLTIGAGRSWLYGYSGLYEQSSTNAGCWQQVTAFPDSDFDRFLASTGELFMTFSGGRSGHAGCALYSSNKWSWLHGEFSNPTFGSDKKTIYLPSHSGVFMRRRPGTLDFEHLQIPSDIFVNVAVDDPSGTLWLGTSDGTFRYQPSQTAPQTIAVATAVELRQGDPLPVVFCGQERFEKNNDPASFRYSWRIDHGHWSPFEPWPGTSLKLPALSSGPHRLEVRARDVDGNVDATPATVKFTLLAEPLQSQPWFVPLVALVAVLLAWLVWLSLANIRKIAATNSVLREEITIRRQTETALEQARGELEHRVTERTEQLSRSNQQLKHEIAERHQAEAHQRKLEEQLHQSQKMEAIGTLAGGIAHDFNNILAVIIPYCDLVSREVSDRPDLQKQLGVMLKAADRAKNLVQQILTFSRRQLHQQRQVCDLQPAVKEALKLLRSALPSTIQMSQKISRTHPVLADPTQIHQVIMNLCVNAQHAMEGRQGQLEVGLDEVPVDEILCGRNPDLRPGPYVRLSVRDTGCGISPENLKRIFEPFFTTRDVGKGTGLGLAVVHGIVQNHDGAILVQSQPGQGTEFQILLPAQLEAVVARPPDRQPPPPANGEHILIVDDEPAIINVLEQLLALAGYKVTAHADPHAALKDFLARPTDIHLVLTDLTMPGMNGLELAGKIYAIRPDLPVIIATGFNGDLITKAQLAEHPNLCKVVEKPLNPENIIRLVSEQLHPGDPA